MRGSYRARARCAHARLASLLRVLHGRRSDLPAAAGGQGPRPGRDRPDGAGGGQTRLQRCLEWTRDDNFVRQLMLDGGISFCDQYHL